VTGGKGLHLMAPIEQPTAHDAARQYARRLVQTLVDKKPDRYLLSASPAGRRRRIFLDYLRNGRGNTAIGAYSPRARPHFPIASAVTWSQVEQGIGADAYTIRSPFRQIKHAAE
jgi:bifunctional non-homologous end joining protein LigD